jgi:hypothetical protein
MRARSKVITGHQVDTRALGWTDWSFNAVAWIYQHDAAIAQPQPVGSTIHSARSKRQLR